MNNYARYLIIGGVLVGFALPTTNVVMANNPEIPEHHTTHTAEKRETVKKILFIGDSMTGWLSEALNSYGRENGFEVSTIVWDGSTIAKWGKSTKLESIINEQKPDAVFVSLGMNELFDTNPSHLSDALGNIKKAVGNRPMVWVGPPSWPGHNKGETLNHWLASELGEKTFFRSFDLNLPRQGAKNPHPTREGMIKWVDAIMEWAPAHSEVNFPENIVKPTKEKMSRGKYFIYKRAKETL